MFTEASGWLFSCIYHPKIKEILELLIPRDAVLVQLPALQLLCGSMYALAVLQMVKLLSHLLKLHLSFTVNWEELSSCSPGFCLFGS